MDGVFLGLAGLLLGISLGLRPWEIPHSSPASPWKIMSIPPLLLVLTQYAMIMRQLCFGSLVWHSCVLWNSLPRECNTTNTPSAPSRTHWSKNGNYQSISHAKKPLNRTKVAGTSLKKSFFLTISTFSSALMKGPSCNIESLVKYDSDTDTDKSTKCVHCQTHV